MRYFYKNKDTDFYNPRLIDNPFIWLLGCLIVFVGCLIAICKGYTLNGLTQYVAIISGILFVGLLTWQLYQAKRHLGKIMHIFSYLLNYGLVAALDTSILNSKSAAAMTNLSYRVIPKIWLWYGGKAYHIKIQKLAGSYNTDLDHVAELVSSTLGDRYAVTSKSIDMSGSWYEITCSRVDENLRFVPKTVTDLKVKPHTIKLMNSLTIPLNKIPHVAVFGLTGSRKSTVLMAILAEVIGEADCYFLDGKAEFQPLKAFMPQDHFATDPEDVTKLLERLLTIGRKRSKLINGMVKKRGVMGLTACDIGLKPVYIFVDEFASIRARYDKPRELEKLMLQCLMTFRSFGMYVIYASQSPSTQVLSNQMRQQFGTYILLGTADSDTQRMAFGSVATTGTVPIGSGYYLEKTAETPTPQRFEVPDLYKNHLNTITVLKQLYEQGEKTNGKSLRRRKIQVKR